MTDVVTVTLNPALDWTLFIPTFAPGAVNRVASESLRPGGKGVNVATALSSSFRVAATGFLGNDNAAAFASFLAGHDIADEFIRVPGATRIGIKIVSAGDTTDINFPGFHAVDLSALRERIGALAQSRPYFVLAGSVPPSVTASIYRDLMNDLAGCRVALDTSGEPLRFALEARPDVIKPNIHELEALVGSPLTDHAAIVDAARSLDVPLVAVSMGEQGALFITREETVLAKPPPITVGSTVGAGDAMVAGIVAAQLAAEPLEALARTATEYSLRALGGTGEITIRPV